MEYPYRLYLSKFELEPDYEYSRFEDFEDFDFEYNKETNSLEDEDILSDE